MNCTFDYSHYYKIEGGEETKYVDVERINSNLFYNFQGIYVLKKVEEADHLPEFVKISGKICRKYLKIFFLHITLSKLTTNQTIFICDIRLKYLNKITSIEYNKTVISELIKRSVENINAKNNKRKILDYGIGSGISLECLRSLKLDDNLELIGTDISKESLEVCTRKGIDTFHWHDNSDIHDEQFDAIISSFVFDFNITYIEVKRLYNLLTKGGRLVLNLYKDDLLNCNRVTNNLLKAGFSVNDELVRIPEKLFDIGHKFEKVVIAQK